MFRWLILFVPVLAMAHPVPFKDGTSITTLNQPFLSDTMVAYSFKNQAAVAARIMSFDDQIGQMRFYAPQLNFLLARSNRPDSQSNLYAFVGLGPMEYDRHLHSAILTGVSADAESRWLFASAMGEKMWTGEGYDFWHSQTRLGVAPYSAGYNQLATWFMVQYDYNPILRSKSKLTPLVRLFYQTVLIEMGVSTDQDWMLNFMVHI